MGHFGGHLAFAAPEVEHAPRGRLLQFLEDKFFRKKPPQPVPLVPFEDVIRRRTDFGDPTRPFRLVSQLGLLLLFDVPHERIVSRRKIRPIFSGKVELFATFLPMDTVVSLFGNDPRRIGGTEEYARELSAQLGRHGWSSVLCFSRPPAAV